MRLYIFYSRFKLCTKKSIALRNILIKTPAYNIGNKILIFNAPNRKTVTTLVNVNTGVTSVRIVQEKNINIGIRSCASKKVSSGSHTTEIASGPVAISC